MATASALFSDAAANKTKGRTPSSLLPVRGVPYTTSPIRSVRRIGSEDVRHIPSPPCPECCRRAIGRERLRQARRPAPNRQSQPFVRLNGALRRRGAVRLNSRHTLCSLHSARPNPRCFCPNRRQPQQLTPKQFQFVRSNEGGHRYVLGTLRIIGWQSRWQSHAPLREFLSMPARRRDGSPRHVLAWRLQDDLPSRPRSHPRPVFLRRSWAIPGEQF